MVYCKMDDLTKEVRSETRYLAILNPSLTTADSLLNCLESALDRINVTFREKEAHLSNESSPVLVGGGTDGASVNVGVHTGMKAQMQEVLPWLFWSWCFSHCLELACKDACTSPLFKKINEMLLRLFYVYSKSSKKSAQLGEIVKELESVYHYPKGGNLPIRCQGIRWIAHKRRAMQRIVDRFGAYITHLEAMVNDSSVKPDDKAKLVGYHRKWASSDMLMGCAMYIDVLKAPSILSLALQNESVDIVQGIKNILKSVTSLQSLSRVSPKEWPTVKLVLSRIESDMYQGTTLAKYNEGSISNCSRQAKADLDALDDTIKKRLSWSDLKLLRSILVFIDTQCWARPQQGLSKSDSDEVIDDKVEIRDAMEYIITVFREPLEAKGTCIFALVDEIDEVVHFYRKYIESQAEGDYKKVWYKLFNAADSRKWSNVLLVTELLFALPFTNSKVERTFSTMKVVKTDQRTSLKTDTLDDLMEINVEGPSLDNFSADRAINLWWSDRTRRPNQKPRKEYRKRKQTNNDDSDPEETASDFSIDHWDAWFADDDSDS